MAVKESILDRFRVCPQSGGWKSINIPPPAEGSDDSPELRRLRRVGICPHFELLCEAAKLLGISEELLREKHEFCGQVVVGVNDLGPLSGRQGREYYPEMVCVQIARALSHMLAAIRSSQRNAESVYANLRKAFESEDPSSAEIDKATDLLKMMREGRFLMATLLENVPMVGNPARPRTECEAVKYAKALLASLTAQVIGDMDIRDMFSGRRILCEQCPRMDFFGLQG